MECVIIEDEKQSAQLLEKLLIANFDNIQIKAMLRSVEESILWFQNNPSPDLVFIDIELSDGTSFEVLEQVQITSKLIFTTAYDQHAVKAFDFNSIAYLLKPITLDKLKNAVQKIDMGAKITGSEIIQKLESFINPGYKKRFLVKKGEKFWHIPTEDIAYLCAEDGLTIGYLFDGRKHFIDYTLDDLETKIEPDKFFRINRKLLININSILTVKTYFSRRLMLEVEPKTEMEVIVAKERVAAFKLWLDN